MNHSNDQQPAARSMAEQVVLWCIKHGYPIPTPHATEDKYDGLKACFRNVVRTNNSRKLQYCVASKQEY